MPQLFDVQCPTQGKLNWGNLPDDSVSLAIFNAARNHPGIVVVVTDDNLQATTLCRQLNFYNHPEVFPVLLFPDWEILPYDQFSPHADIISERITVLYKLSVIKKGILIVPMTTLMQRLSPAPYLSTHSFILKIKDILDIPALRIRLEKNGYRCVSQVYEHGEFAIRGSLIDLYPMGGREAFRIDLFDNEVETIRTFDPDTQRSITPVNEISLLPAREFPLSDDAIAWFRQQWRAKFQGNPTQCAVYQDVSKGLLPAGIEFYLPLFFDQLQTLFDYLPENSVWIRHAQIHHIADKFWKDIKERYEDRAYDILRPILPPHELYLAPQEVMGEINRYAHINWQTEKVDNGENFQFKKLPDLKINPRNADPLQSLKLFLQSEAGRVIFCAESAGRRLVYEDILSPLKLSLTFFESWSQAYDSNEKYGIVIGEFEHGFWLENPVLACVPESILLGQAAIKTRRSKSKTVDADAIIRNLSELSIGAPIVHIEHGVGRYQGLKTLTINGIETEFLTIIYADDAKLYVPVSALHVISRYSGVDNEHAPLNKLGNESWAKLKRKACDQIRDVAAELLKIYAARQARTGQVFNYSKHDFELFSQGFPFEETEDQGTAIEQVVTDMTAPKPMDRLICGDVGFGKTEVAMRAAFIAAQNGLQVAVLVPTTLLAQQHYETFQDRFANWPVKIEVLSRFRTHKEQAQSLAKLSEGCIDIIIGTHRLLQKDVKFKNLGLVIIDEEHRFGVSQKERLKQLRAEVDVLALTATPIPRTLNMSLQGIRDLSVIATPPARRLSIKTFVRERYNPLIREAIMREILRGGQVYFLHNKVETINKIGQEIELLVPEARIGIAHGQMHERELEKIMADFYHQRFNVLICTTIIETGIDIPTANTIIMDHADRFGLAQLHQLRGRVGRSHHQAYAYLLVPSLKTISSDAKKRLEAITSLEDLGAGFTLATHDLEIRGAGELLGEEQSGNMQAIGFSLYMELLEKAVSDIKEGRAINLEEISEAPEIDLHMPVLLPEFYVGDINERLILYKRIAESRSDDHLLELQAELVDRFGALPPQTKNLFSVTSLKLKAARLKIKKIEVHPQGGYIEFKENTTIDPAPLLMLIQKSPQQYRFDGPMRFKFIQNLQDNAVRLEVVKELLRML